MGGVRTPQMKISCLIITDGENEVDIVSVPPDTQPVDKHNFIQKTVKTIFY